MLQQLTIKHGFLISIILLAGCSSQEKADPVVVIDGEPESISIDIAAIEDAVPRYEPWSASVNPASYVVLGKEYRVLRTNKGFKQQGIASWYGTKFHQKKTATGEMYDMFKMTAAHKTLPIPSYVQVTNIDNQRSVIVRVNDRGPFHEHRIIDLSYAVAVKLGLDKSGTGFVDVLAVQPGDVKVATNSVISKKIYYQIGAFSVLDNATLLQEKVVALQLTKNRIVSSVAPEGSLLKLQIGPISSVAEADDISLKLKKVGIVSGHYISE